MVLYFTKKIDGKMRGRDVHRIFKYVFKKGQTGTKIQKISNAKNFNSIYEIMVTGKFE